MNFTETTSSKKCSKRDGILKSNEKRKLVDHVPLLFDKVYRLFRLDSLIIDYPKVIGDTC